MTKQDTNAIWHHYYFKSDLKHPSFYITLMNLLIALRVLP